jgi:hypothetical protein
LAIKKLHKHLVPPEKPLNTTNRKEKTQEKGVVKGQERDAEKKVWEREK